MLSVTKLLNYAPLLLTPPVKYPTSEFLKVSPSQTFGEPVSSGTTSEKI